MKKTITMLTILLLVFFMVGIVSGEITGKRSNAATAFGSLDNSQITFSKLSNDNQTNVRQLQKVLSAVLPVLQFGGDRLVETQYIDGSWGWPLNAPPTYGNILGPIAMGLGQGYDFTEDLDHLAGLAAAGGYLLTKTNNFSPSDGYLAAKLDEIFGGSTYSDHLNTNFYGPLAAGTYDRNGAGTLYSTQSYITLIHNARHGSGIGNLAAWDIAMGLVGAASCGVTDPDLGYWVDGVKIEIDLLDGGNYYDVIGLAGAIYGLAFVGEDFDPTSGEHAGASNIDDLADILALYQIELGGFAWNSGYVISNDNNETIQETAYALLALNEVDRCKYSSNILGAKDYMINMQLGTGGWENYVGSTSGENNEVTGEAMWGIAIGNDTAPVVITDSITLWPPNHKYHTVLVSDIVTSVSDDYCLAGIDDVVITKVTSDEEEDAIGKGDGKTTDDILFTDGCSSVDLRAECDGVGNGRVYTIHLEVFDGSNVTAATCLVEVPHDVKDVAVDDGPVYEVTSECGGSIGNISAREAGNGNSTSAGLNILPNYPNPFNPSTTILYELEKNSKVTVQIFDISGHLISTLVNSEQPKGRHSAVWNGRNQNGEVVPAGIYMNRIMSGNEIKTNKIMLLK